MISYIWPNVTDLDLAGAMIVTVIYRFVFLTHYKPFSLTYLNRMACSVYYSRFVTPVVHFGARHDIGRRMVVYIFVLAPNQPINPRIYGATSLAADVQRLEG